MPRIIELDTHLADLIAAGEVVEKPASVIKELMENSIDAGAGIITVEINAGGMTYMRVTDNGCGIAPEDAKTAFLRHATSKLKSADGLGAIGTLGFRGEALAAIAAVSRIELLTREADAAEGVSLSLEAGRVTDFSPAGCPEGTTIIVRDLFYNTPARLKFVKSDRAESSGIAAAVLRCALSHPEISVRFIRDGKTEYHTPGDSKIASAIYSLFGREFAAALLPAQTSDETIKVEGYVSSPSAARGNRSYQFFFVNGRHIKSKTLQAALEQAYANSMPPGRYPACVLYINTRHSDVDVNVHPAKTEIKFVSDKPVFDGVYYAALGAIDGSGAGPVPSESTVQSAAAQTLTDRRTPAYSQMYQQANPPQQTQTYPQTQKWRAAGGGDGFKTMPAEQFRKSFGNGGFKTTVPPDKERASSAPVHDENRAVYQTKFTPPETEPGIINGESFRFIGEAMGTYIVAEYKSSVWLIDKHAAHERIHFDVLRAGKTDTMSQTLITPIICRHGQEDSALLLENAKLLDSLGFSAEPFGTDAIAVRQIPSDIELSDAEPVLSEICAELKRGGITESARRDNVLKTVACKAAIKAGKTSAVRELEALAGRVLSGEIRYCPHGRPVAVEMTKNSLDRSFKRT